MPISGEVKFRDRKGYRDLQPPHPHRQPSRHRVKSRGRRRPNPVFITSWNAENKHMNTQEFLRWTYTLKPFFTPASLTCSAAARVDVRQHLMRHFMDIEVTRAELEDLRHSSLATSMEHRQDDDVERPARSRGRSPPRPASSRGNDLTAAGSTSTTCAPRSSRADGQRSRVEPQAVMREYELASVIERMSGGYAAASSGATARRCRNSARPTITELLPQQPTGPGDFDVNCHVSHQPAAVAQQQDQGWRWAPPSHNPETTTLSTAVKPLPSPAGIIPLAPARCEARSPPVYQTRAFSARSSTNE